MAKELPVPIPGENFTSDVKSYPWHRPPEFTDIDDALDYIARKITDFQVANTFLTLAEIGVPLWKIADFIVTAGIGEGKWTPDFALLLAGPITKMIETMCIAFDVEYDLDLDEDEKVFTGTFFKGATELKAHKAEGAYKIVKEELPEIKNAAANQENPEGGEAAPEEKTGGFMSMMGA